MPGVRRQAALVATVLVLVGAVALAARGDHEDRTAAAFTVGDGANTAAGVALAAVTALALVVLVWALWPSEAAAPRPRRRRGWRDVVAMVLAGAALAAMTSSLRPAHRRAEQDRQSQVELGRPVDRGAPVAREPASATWSLVTAGLALAALGAGASVTVVRLRRRQVAGGELGAVAPDVDATDTDGRPGSIARGSVADAVAAARAERDPRASILLALAAAERALRDTPDRRRPTESPREWSTRAGLRALAQLVSVYEIARFSDDEVTAADREIALAALDAMAGSRTG